MLIDEGHLERTNGHWTARGDLSRVSVPGTIGALLSARLDQLEAGERAVIQRASVVGRVFWWGAVTDLSPEDDRSEVGSHLQTLLRKELVRPDRSGFAGEDAFRFSHILVRDAAYDSMPKRARAELHERFASWLERKAGGRIAEFEEILGYHLEQAFRYRSELGPADDAAWGLGERGARHLASAAARAMAQSDTAATVNLLSRAVDLVPADHRLRLEMLPDLGVALARSDIVRADAVLTEAVEAARAIRDRRIGARAGTTRVFVRLLLDPTIGQAESLREVEGYAAVLEEIGDDGGLADALTLIGTISFWQGEAAVSVERFERAIDHARRAGDRRSLFQALRWIALATSEGPTPAADGVRRLEWILEQAVGDRSVEMAVSRARAVFEAMAGRFDEARAMVARGTALANEIGDELSVAALLREGGAIELLAGDPAAAERELRAAYEILDSRQDVGHLSSTAPDLGEALVELGRAEEALRISEYTETISIEGDVDANVRWRKLRGRALARLGRHHEAEPFALEAVRMIEATDYVDLHAHVLMALAEVRRVAGRTTEAADDVRKAIELYRRKENVTGERLAAALLAGPADRA